MVPTHMVLIHFKQLPVWKDWEVEGEGGKGGRRVDFYPS